MNEWNIGGIINDGKTEGLNLGLREERPATNHHSH